MLESQSTLIPLTTYKNNRVAPTYAAPSHLFTLERILPPIVASGKDSQSENDISGSSGELVHSMHLYDCFNERGDGHEQAANELFDKGVWIGYFSDES
jgi:hypothetical protein